LIKVVKELKILKIASSRSRGSDGASSARWHVTSLVQTVYQFFATGLVPSTRRAYFVLYTLGMEGCPILEPVKRIEASYSLIIHPP